MLNEATKKGEPETRGARVRRHEAAKAATALEPFRFLLIALLVIPLVSGDTVTDAKRQAAIQLLRDGKGAEAAAIIKEVLAVDPSDYRDQMLLARACEKAQRPADELDAWRRLLAELPSVGGEEDQQIARVEAVRRIRQLDPSQAAIEASLGDLPRRLSMLERDPAVSRNPVALERVLKVLVAVDELTLKRFHTTCVIKSTALWTDSGVVVQAGRTYRIHAFGTWRTVANDPTTECDADGLKSVPADECGPVGSMGARITTAGGVIPVGKDLTLTPSISGALYFACNEGYRAGTAGEMRVYITAVQ